MKRKIQIFLSFAVGALLVWWLFRDTDTDKLSEAIGNADWRWLLLGQVPLYASFFTRMFRWRYIVRSTGNLSFRGMLSATQIGFLANFTLPMRVGEFIRAIVLTRLEQIPISKSLALCGLDRVTDIFGLITILAFAIVGFPTDRTVVIPKGTIEGMTQDFILTPAFVRGGSSIIGLGLVVLIATLVMLYVNQERMFRINDTIFRLAARAAGTFSARLARFVEFLGAKAKTMLLEFAGGLHVFRSPGDMIKSTAWSLVTWGLFMLGTLCFLKAFHIETPWYGVFVVQSLVALSTGIAVAPGFIGQFHLGVILGVLVAAPSVDISTAKALAIVVHLLNLLPIVVMGVFCLILERDRLSGVPMLKTAVEVKAGHQI